MGFFDRIDNSTIVDNLKQLLKRRDREYFHGHHASWNTLLECALPTVEDHKIHTLAGHHQTVSTSVLSNNGQFAVC